MYFVLAIHYLFSAVGFLSIVIFVGLILCMTESEAIEKDIGYRNYFFVLGVYALIALPLAATLAGGFNNGFLFYLGCSCPGIWTFGDVLAKHHVARRAQLLAAAAPSPAAMPSQGEMEQPSVTAGAAAPAYVPAPSSLIHDFDVPPQR